MNSLDEIYRRFLVYFVTLVAFSCVYLLLGYESDMWNGLDEENDNTFLKKAFNRFYFTVVSFSTIGYGDVSPKSFKLKGVTIFFAMCLILEVFTLVFRTKWHSRKR